MTGSPGIGMYYYWHAKASAELINLTGKSFLIIWALVNRLAGEKTTLLTLTNGETYLFCKEGAFSAIDRAPLSEAICAIACREDLASRPWSLIDPVPDQRGPPVNVSVPNLLFPVQCVSPDPARYKLWTKAGGLFWIMQPWTDTELITGSVYLIDFFIIADRSP